MDEPPHQRRRGPLGYLLDEFSRSPALIAFTVVTLAALSLVAFAILFTPEI
jgi:hypothetical protein